MNQIIAFRTAIVVGLSVLLAARVTQVQHARHEAAMPHGRYTREQIYARSMPLFGAFAKNCESLRVTASPIRTWDMRVAINIWTVDGVDPQGRFRAHLVWNADTGDLMFVSPSAHSMTSDMTGRLLNRKEAQRITMSWLTTLGMSERATGWRPVSTSCEDLVWRVEWGTDTRAAIAMIDARTGELKLAETVNPAWKAEQRHVAQAKWMKEMMH